MAVAGRRRSSARSTEVTPGREPDRQSSRGRNQPCSARNSQCLTFLPTRTMTGADMRPAPRYHLAYRVGRRTRTVAFEAANPRDRLCSAVSGRSRRFYWAIAAVLPKTPR